MLKFMPFRVRAAEITLTVPDAFGLITELVTGPHGAGCRR
jgi:hypothetical protein